ncbi:extracellular solute-binding protein [Paenibacillus sp. LMG 31456]|uniref:Extracellular solute-binding protein n=1 Tax=Paenibacillus foliorum TaxID=2654974 RepID=A0A972GS55_9BACL|nr:extracellular solute-binding protein [Paenibacillus foliorum]NOU95742.1 extracellular solute-binding protein [Paenibacillus foliorum]
MQKRLSRKHFRARLEVMIGTLRQEILSGKLAIGSYLPSESDLEKRFELSNASVRSGLKVLVEEGFIEKIPRVGNKVLSPSSEQKTVIKFGYVHSFARLVEMEELLAEFSRQFPHIVVQPIELPSSSYSKSLKHYMESEILDVVLINNNNFQDFVENGCTHLLEPIEQVDDLYPFLTQPFRQGDNTQVRPFNYSPVVLCYNKKHFEQSQVPLPDSSWAWSDLFKYGQQLSVKNERFGFYFYMPSRNRWPIFMLQSGTSFQTDENGNYRLRGSKIIESLEACRELLAMTDVFPRILSESDADAEALFLEGKVSVIMTTYFFLNQLRDSNISFDVSPLPGLQDTSTLLIINGLAVNSRSSNKEAAKLLVDFLSSYEIQLLLRRKTLNITAHRHAMEWEGEESLYRPSRFFLYKEIFPTLRLITELGLSNYQLKSIQRDIMLFLSGLQNSDVLSAKLEQLLIEAKESNIIQSS